MHKFDHFPVETLKLARAVLYRASLYMQRYGWTQHSFGSQGYPRCAAGLMSSGAFSPPAILTQNALDAAYLALVQQLPPSYRNDSFGVHNWQVCLIVWNDEPGRTSEEVMDRFVGAIELLTEQIAARTSSTDYEAVESAHDSTREQSLVAF
jgi:hypothetical protein